MHQNVNLLQSRFLCLHSKYIYHSGKGAEEEKKKQLNIRVLKGRILSSSYM